MLSCRLNTFDLFGFILNFPRNTAPLLNKGFLMFRVSEYGNTYRETDYQKCSIFKPLSQILAKQETFVCKLLKNSCGPVERASLTVTKKSKFPRDLSFNLSSYEPLKLKCSSLFAEKTVINY